MKLQWILFILGCLSIMGTGVFNTLGYPDIAFSSFMLSWPLFVAAAAVGGTFR